LWMGTAPGCAASINWPATAPDAACEIAHQPPFQKLRFAPKQTGQHPPRMRGSKITHPRIHPRNPQRIHTRANGDEREPPQHLERKGTGRDASLTSSTLERTTPTSGTKRNRTRCVAYLLDLGEAELQGGVNPGEDLVAPDEVGAVHRADVGRRHRRPLPLERTGERRGWGWRSAADAAAFGENARRILRFRIGQRHAARTRE
jgi:hypothetical protein